MRYQAECRLEYAVNETSTFIFNIAAARTALQQVESESLTVTPELPVEEFVDPVTGNRTHRLEATDCELVVHYRVVVETSPVTASTDGIRATPPRELPWETIPYVVPSRHCESDLLMRLAWREFGYLPESLERVKRINTWVHENVDYLAGTTAAITSAFNTVTARAGVCRDFAHLGIAFCRAVNIPARFVSAYAYDLHPPDFHAVYEAWLDGRWYLFDPTGLASRGGLVRVGTGRDAADVSFAHIFGPAVMTGMRVTAEACDEESRELPGTWAACAVSTA